jgi:excinuclease UvrABC ATPase subunit
VVGGKPETTLSDWWRKDKLASTGRSRRACWHVVIEHTLEVIKTAHWIIDLGPDGGDGGGTIVAAGTPEDVVKVKVKESYTGSI